MKKRFLQRAPWFFTLVFAAFGLIFLLAIGATANQEVSDTFERQNLGANWSIPIGNVAIVNNSDLGFSAQSPIGIAVWAGTTLGTDQYSEAVVAPNKVSNMLTQVFVRRRASDAARYGFHYANDPNTVAAWQIKYDGVPTAQTRILASSNAAAPNPGDTLRLEVKGSNPVELKGYHNGTLVLSATDSNASAVTSGPPGMAFRLQIGTSTTYPSPVFESWRGGNLTAPPAEPTPPAPTPAPQPAPAPPQQTSSQPSTPAPANTTTNNPAPQPAQNNLPAPPGSSESTQPNTPAKTTQAPDTVESSNDNTTKNSFIKIGVILGSVSVVFLLAAVLIKSLTR